MPAHRKGDAVERHIGTVYVANLPWSTTEDELEAVFAPHVPVVDVRVIQDKKTGRSRGFGFVEVQGQGAVEKAVSCLNGCELKGRKLLVTPALHLRGT
jgi:RNA recognition motif-containing protein